MKTKRPAAPKWMKPLTKYDKQHLKDTSKGRPTLKGFKETFKWQQENNINCWDCWIIAKRLGLLVD
jgi:hypothetical protein